MKIYADHAATSPISEAAKAEMIRCLDEQYGNPSSLHEWGRASALELAKFRESIAEDIGAQPNEIYFTSGGSEADNQAILSAARIGAKKGRKRIITSDIEHHAVLHTVDKLAAEGFDVVKIPAGERGIVSVKDVEAALTDETALVTIMMANNEIGTIQPVKEIGELCRERRVLFHTDAVQAVGHIPVDVKELKVDMLSFSAHKFRGPRGIGVLYCRRGGRLFPSIEGGAQENNKRAGTENLAAIAGMAAALHESVENLENSMKYTSELRDVLIEGLKKIPLAIINGDEKQRLPGNVNVCFPGIEGESLLLYLDARGIAASSGSACTSGSLDPSHVLLAIGLPHETAHGSLRLTIDDTNTREEAEYIIKNVAEVVEFLRSISPVWEKMQQAG